MTDAPHSEIRASTVRALLERVRKRSYAHFLLSLRLERFRLFSGDRLSFDFPVTALIGPNGGGKSTILGICACIYSDPARKRLFLRSRLGDDKFDGSWHVDYDIIDRTLKASAPVSGAFTYDGETWRRSVDPQRPVVYLNLMRTIPLNENPQFVFRSLLTRGRTKKKAELDLQIEEIKDAFASRIRTEGARILDKALTGYRFFNIRTIATKPRWEQEAERVVLPDGRRAIVVDDEDRIVGTKRLAGKRQIVHSTKEMFATGKNDCGEFSELNFGAGESSVLRIVAEIEAAPDGSLILVEEIENGLHPVAVRRLVEYLIEVAHRKAAQVIFTTHNDHALQPLPGEAIWASLNGRLQQGVLSVAALQAIAGRSHKRLAVFVEDEFVKHWLYAILRECASEALGQVGIYPVGGDGNALKAHVAHGQNPSVGIPSLCYLDGDSRLSEDQGAGVFRMSGKMPESTVFDSVCADLDANIEVLTAGCQRPVRLKDEVRGAIESVSRSNRDPHLLFTQVGANVGLVPEATVRGAFLSVWIQQNAVECARIVRPILKALEK